MFVQSHFGLLHLVVCDELCVASTGFHQGLMVSSLADLPVLQNQDVITELQVLENTAADTDSCFGI